MDFGPVGALRGKVLGGRQLQLRKQRVIVLGEFAERAVFERVDFRRLVRRRGQHGEVAVLAGARGTNRSPAVGQPCRRARGAFCRHTRRCCVRSSCSRNEMFWPSADHCRTRHRAIERCHVDGRAAQRAGWWVGRDDEQVCSGRRRRICPDRHEDGDARSVRTPRRPAGLTLRRVSKATWLRARPSLDDEEIVIAGAIGIGLRSLAPERRSACHPATTQDWHRRFHRT